MLLREATILQPYVRPMKRAPKLTLKVLAFIALVLFSLVYGYFVAILPPELLYIPATPLVILIGLILWAMPDTDRVPRSVSAGVLGFFLAFNYIWPAYVAVNLPGLPWINPQRLSLAILLIVTLYGLATSSKLRHEMMDVARAEPIIWKSFAVYWWASLIALPFAFSQISTSFNKWANNQVYWTFLFFVSAYVARKPGGMHTLARSLMIAALVTALISYPEYIMERVPWIGYVPGWLIGDAEIYARVSSDQARLNFDMYRARSSFNVSLSFAEFLSLGLPFFIHAMAEEKDLFKKAVFGAAIVMIGYSMGILTNARSGMVGLIVGIFGYLAFWVVRRWLTQKHDLIGAAGMLAFPVAAVAFGILVLTWNRLRVMVLGGGQHSYSDRARGVQWDMAMDRLQSNPIGYGPGRAGEVIGYRNPGGDLTLDSYYINVLIDSGLVGFLAFFVFAIATIVVGLRLALTTQDKEVLLAAPAAIALLSLLIIKSVLTQPENLPVMFIFAGAISGLVYRLRGGTAVTQPPAPALRLQPNT